jgi:hypothetical protein
MVEFTEGQEGHHERIHGGEPVLVLCKIYKAHSGSRSSSTTFQFLCSSAAARVTGTGQLQCHHGHVSIGIEGRGCNVRDR